MIFASFDLDGTLVRTIDLIILALEEQGFKPVSGSRRNSFFFRFDKGFSPPPDFMWDLFFYKLFTERHDEIVHVDCHVERFLQEIYDVGNEPIRVITSRPAGMLMHWCTSVLLDRLFPDIVFSIDIVGSSSEKIKYCMGTDIFFEDRRKTVIEMSRQGQIVFMRNESYNDLGNIRTIDIEDMSLTDIKPCDIIVYDDFEQLIGRKLSSIIAPF